ncbi:MAG TPA: methylmalonyl Co-A mutase-associated GTPase MeaB [Tenuifilaceae bacterium]|jgi:LAO/AO transport system kinase|nr:methylmalonyl Co-A mutase-associated GTPase MeaB [Bacteroidales bacterium]HNT40985.1 methylmalonyl Co-A mutase-associated GTPase MeaB [Tenuifilaceae bacterium]MBP8642653.1 methylmalonyl Co-A mutase-associated GTPase MeaB [Bacteroidales bacterium]NLI87556.1 methylmalonyl Co-A mutase-associated GTPase MeaB [Bacteroidales bacterium]HNY08310.1 methylmalonyl Co-A mutase-associated GTPase MeaB [Tenuifilaceae bacterium]
MKQRKNKDDESALFVAPGIDQPPVVNEQAVQKFRQQKRRQPSIDEFVGGILARNNTILSQAITLVESSLPRHYELAQQLIERCLPYSGNSIRVGITGIPGVGKSTFIESLGTMLTSQGHRLAVLAIDPSSTRSKGSILGDKTRMESLSADANAFIRPSPSAGSLGGVARKTRETIILCEAAGFDTVFIETVGVGQSEVSVHSMVDFFLLLMLAGAGDELQGIKRGIMEMADLIAITKADGANISRSKLAQAEFQNALHLFPMPESGWVPKVVTCSALNKVGIDEIWREMVAYADFTRKNGYFVSRRNRQAKYWMHETINEALKNKFYADRLIHEQVRELEKEVVANRLSPFAAAQLLLDRYFSLK